MNYPKKEGQKKLEILTGTPEEKATTEGKKLQ
jgi:hypothetical protein